VAPFPDPLLFFSGSAGNRTRASGSVAKNCVSKLHLSYAGVDRISLAQDWDHENEHDGFSRGTQLHEVITGALLIIILLIST
jgi:hypothetical protein